MSAAEGERVVRYALGVLQDRPDDVEAWAKLRAAVAQDLDEASRKDLQQLFEAARRRQDRRREASAVAELLGLEAAVNPAARTELLLRRGKLLDEELLREGEAEAVYRALGNVPAAEEAAQLIELRRSKWTELQARYLEEAKKATDNALKSSLLAASAEVAYRYAREAAPNSVRRGKKKNGGPSSLEQALNVAKEALALDPRSPKALRLLEIAYREQGRFPELGALLRAAADSSESKETKVSFLLAAARVLHDKADDKVAGAAAYADILDLEPNHKEATLALVDSFTTREQWDELAALYEAQIASGLLQPDDENGILFQAGMVHWRMRNRADSAEPLFQKLLRKEPAHPGVLGFFRVLCTEREDFARLRTILADAARVVTDPKERANLNAELGALSERADDAARSIEQFRAALREDPTNESARDALRRLYRGSGNWTALVELSRASLERTKDPAQRELVLREMADAYRAHIKSDVALLAVLAQLSELQPGDADILRELVSLCEKTGKPRDALVAEQRLAELSKDRPARAEIYRKVARRWLDEFGNAQNAIESYERVREILPDDTEALRQLRELYTKRRAHRPLFELLNAAIPKAESDDARFELLLEAARTAERLELGSEAIALYRRAAELRPADAAALESLEKAAERERDFPAMADALELRARDNAPPEARISSLLRLATLSTDRLSDSERAEKAWRRILELNPGHPKATRSLRDFLLAERRFDDLQEVYGKVADWEGLAEVLSGAADRATTDEDKIALSFRVADVCEGPLGAPERALRAYERVLSVDPKHVRAAERLVPIYEREGKPGRLLPLLEVLAERSDSDHQRAELLRRLSGLASFELRNDDVAIDAADRAFSIEPAESLSLFEQVSRRGHKWTRFLDALKRRSDVAPAAEQTTIRRQLAQLYQELGQEDDAIATYRELAFGSDPAKGDSDAGAVAALEALLRAQGRPEGLREFFEQRVARANTAQKVDLLLEWAQLEEDAFVDPAAAAAIYERVLGFFPDHGGALRSSARIYEQLGDGERALSALTRERDKREGRARAERDVDIARVELRLLKKPKDALTSACRALDSGADLAEAIALVEALLPMAETRARAAEVLEKVYESNELFDKQAEILGILIATRASKNDRVTLYDRLAGVHERLGQRAEAFDLLMRAAREFPGELSLWDRFQRLADETSRHGELADAIAGAVPPGGGGNLPEAMTLELAARAAEIYEKRLSDPASARPYIVRLFDKEPGSEVAFDRVREALLLARDNAGLLAAYDAAIAASPSERQELLLAESAQFAESALHDGAEATRRYERLQVLDPEAAFEPLDVLYTQKERFQEQAKLLEDAILRDLGTRGPKLRKRLVQIYAERVGQPERAVEHAEQVLADDPHERETRLHCETLLAAATDKPLRLRLARLLERVETERGEVREVVRMLEIQLEADGEGKTGLLQRIAELRDEALSDDDGAFDAYRRLLLEDPSLEDVRERMRQIARRKRSWQDFADTMLAAAGRATSPDLKSELYFDAAETLRLELSDPEKAAVPLAEVVTLGGEHALAAAQALEGIHRGAGRKDELAAMLGILAELEPHEVERAAALFRLGGCLEEKGEAPQAIAAFERCLAIEPTHRGALTALDGLYGVSGELQKQLGVVRLREEQSQSSEERRELLLRAAALADQLDENDAAVTAYRTLLEDFGAEASVRDALLTLYAKMQRYEDAADLLAESADAVTDDREQLSLLTRLGQLREDRLEDAEGALEAYRRVLTLEPSAAVARARVEAMLQNTQIRLDVARLLLPLYEAENDVGRILRVLEVEIAEAPGVDDRLELLGRSATLAERDLGQPGKAYDYAARAAEESVGEPSFGQCVVRAEGLAEAASRIVDWALLLERMAGNVVDDEERAELFARLGRLYRDKLDHKGDALAWFEKAREVRGDDPQTLTSLEALYRDAEKSKELEGVYAQLFVLAETDEERVRLLFARAELHEGPLADLGRAIELYEEILDVTFDARAAARLADLYLRESRVGDLLSLYERELALDATQEARRVELHFLIGKVSEERAEDAERAVEAYGAALRIDPSHQATIGALERLLTDPTCARSAADLLEEMYLAKADWLKVIATLEARLETETEAEERRRLLVRIGSLHEEQREDFGAALGAWARVFADDPTDVSAREELERLAPLGNAQIRLGEIYVRELGRIAVDGVETADIARRAAEILEQQGDRETALVQYRRHLAFAPAEHRASFAAVDRLLLALGRAEERVEHLQSGLDDEADDASRVRTLHVVAEVQERELAQVAAAIDTYRAALAIDDRNTQTLDALERLFAAAGRHADLSELLQRRIEVSEGTDDEAKHRLALAKLSATSGAPRRAIDEYGEVLERRGVRSADGEVARAALEALLPAAAEDRLAILDLLAPAYEELSLWEELVASLELRATLVPEPLDQAQLLRRVAEIHERQLAAPERALDALTRAVQTSPGDADLRAELERLGREHGLWDGVVAAYEGALAAADEVDKADILTRLSHIHDEVRDDPRRALEAYERLHAIRAVDLEGLDDMDRFATLLSDWKALERILTAKVEVQLADEDRASTWRRLAEARRDMLDDPKGAVESYERALELEPQSTFTLDHLIALYEEGTDKERLLGLYRKRIELEDDAEARFPLLRLAAAVAEELDDLPQALELLEDAEKIEEAPVLTDLARLLEKQAIWDGLLANLDRQVALGTAPDVIARVHQKRGEVFVAHEKDDARAVEAFGLSLDAQFERAAFEPLMALAASAELRPTVVALAEPIARRHRRYAELTQILDLRLSLESDPKVAARTLEELASLCDTQLADGPRAFGYLLRALPETDDPSRVLADLDRLAAGEGDLRRHAEALEALAEAGKDAALFERLGRLLSARLDDRSGAAKAYERALAISGDDVRLLSELATLYGDTADVPALRTTLLRHVAVSGSPHELADLRYRLATLAEDKREALEHAEAALEQDQRHEPSVKLVVELLAVPALAADAFRVLDRVYHATSRTDERVALHERKIGAAEGASARRAAREEFARMLEKDNGNARAAMAAVGAIVLEDASDGANCDELERLAEKTGDYAEAAETLSAAIEALGADTATLTRADLWMRVGRLFHPRGQNGPRAEAAYERAVELDPARTEALGALVELRRVPARERDLVDTIRRLSRVERDPEAALALLRDARGIAEHSVGDTMLAEAVLEDALARDGSSHWALENLVRLRERRGTGDIADLMLRLAEVETDERTAASWKERAAARLAEAGEAQRAISLFEDLVRADPESEGVLGSLRDLYGRVKEPRELSRTLSYVVSETQSRDRQIGLRLELATLYETELSSPEDAVEALRAVVREEPAHPEARRRLGVLLEKLGKYDEWAELLEQERKEGGDVAVLYRLADLYEVRLADTGRALGVYEDIVAADAAQEGALGAVARLSEKRGDLKRAAEALTGVAATQASEAAVPTYLRVADLRARLGELDASEESLRSAIRHGSAEARTQLQKAFAERKKWAELAELLVEEIDGAAATHAGDLRRRAAKIFIDELSQPERAIPLLEDAARENAADKTALAELVDAYEKAGRTREASEVLVRLIATHGGKRTKELAALHHRLGRALVDLGENERALAELDTAFKIEPGNVAVLRDLGRHALAQGDLDRAQKTFRALLLQKLDASSPITKGEVFFHLGEIAERQGDKPKAIQMFERAAENDATLKARERIDALKQ